MKKYKKLFIIILLVIISLTATYLIFLKYRGQSKPIEIERYGVSIGHLDGKNIDNYIVDIMDAQDYLAYNVKFYNRTNRGGKFVLIVYLDYNQVKFKTNSGEYVDKYEFDLDAQKDIIIPISFNFNNHEKKSHSLTVSVLAGANKYAYDIHQVTDSYGCTANFILNNGNYEQEILSESLLSNVATFKQSQDFSGIIMSCEDLNKDSIKIPKDNYHVKSGEYININVIAGGYKNVEEYVMWATLDWKQVQLEDSKQFIYFKVPKGECMQRAFKIKAPEKPGKYDICGYLVKNPKNPLDRNIYTSIQVDTSFRFTLIVE